MSLSSVPLSLGVHNAFMLKKHSGRHTIQMDKWNDHAFTLNDEAIVRNTEAASKSFVELSNCIATVRAMEAMSDAKQEHRAVTGKGKRP